MQVVTGSFDKTAKIWNSETGELLHTLRGHATEIVCLSFDPHGMVVATGSMDSTAKLWDVSRGVELCSLMGHTAEIVSLNFNTEGDKIITGSFDHTTRVWDVNTGADGRSLAQQRVRSGMPARSSGCAASELLPKNHGCCLPLQVHAYTPFRATEGRSPPRSSTSWVSCA